MIYYASTSATTTIELEGFWNLSNATSGLWIYSDCWAPWVFKKEEGIDLDATEKNVIDYPKGKLRMPKPQCPKGFKHLTLRNEFSGPHFR